MSYNFKLSSKRVLMIVMMLTLFLTGCIFAAENSHAAVGSLNGREYDDFDDLCDHLNDDYGGKTVTIEMLRNWDYNESHDFDQRLIIPGNCKATLNMNGYVFDRMLSMDNDWEYNGELICIRGGATLTVNGGTKSRAHSEPVYSSVDSGNKASKWVMFYGGVLTGGCSTGGAGGIHISGSDVTLTLNDVTLAGCRAECPWYDSAGTNSGYGGGIWATGGNTTIRLNGSTITGNHSQLDGGGIFTSNHNNVKIEMTNSHVDSNYARSDGGGINMDGESLSITGDYKSTVSNNVTNGLGGGIYLWNDEVTVSNLIIEGNRAKQGGGIYSLEETIALNGLTIKNNTSTDKGGGIYIANDGHTISNCTIQGNNKYGVYVEDDVDEDFIINGDTSIRDNSGGNLTLQNDSSRVTVNPSIKSDVHIGYVSYKDVNQISPLYSIDMRKYLIPDSSDYEVTYSYDDVHEAMRVNFLVKKGRYEELDPKGDAPIKYDGERVTKKISEAGPEIIGSVGAGGDGYTRGTSGSSGKYALIRGLLHREVTDSGGEDKENLFYYSDGLFYGDPYVFNEHLGTASWSLAFGGTYLRLGGSKAESYKYKHTGARQFFADIGCPDQNIYINDSMASKPGTDSIGCTIGSKKLQKYNDKGELEDTGDILIPIAVRGGGYENEWASNVLLGDGTTRDGEAQGFSEAADQVMQALEYYIAKYSLEDELQQGKVKFWVSGFSRAGATANITSKRIIEKYACDDATPGKNNKVFSYPCEAAKGGTDKAQKLDSAKYYCIHNMVNSCDVVPYVGPQEMGFKRYGVDHYIPGTTAGDVKENVFKLEGSWNGYGGSSGITKVTTYSDNVPLKTKPNTKSSESMESFYEYARRRTAMLPYLDSIDSAINFDDFFQPYGVSFFPLGWGKVSSYTDTNLDDFLADFMAFFQYYGLKNHNGRKGYSEDITTINQVSFTTIEKAARDFMSTDSLSTVTGNLSSIIGQFSYANPFTSDVTMFELYRKVLGEWETLPEKDKLYYMYTIWSAIKKSGALDGLPDEQVAALERNIHTVLDFALYYADGDWDSYPDKKGYSFPSGRAWAVNTDSMFDMDTHFMMYSYTLVSHMSMILRNHDPELNMAWCRTDDSWFNEIDDPATSYNDSKAEYIVKWGELDGKPVDGDPYRVDAPKAAVAELAGDESEADYDPEDHKLKENDKTANSFAGNQKILLEVGKFNDSTPGSDNVIGEAIYYDLDDVTEGDDKAKSVAKEQVYRGGVDLSISDDEGSKVYKITAYARSYGVHSDKATYYVNMRSDKHTVYAYSAGSDAKADEYAYAEGSKVTLTAKDVTGKQFEYWKITTKDENDGTVDVTDTLLEGKDAAKSKTITFTMPATDEEGSTWKPDYAITATAYFYDKIKGITVTGLAAPVTARPLGETAAFTFDNGAQSIKLPVTWSYEFAGDETTEGGTAIQPAGSNAYEVTDYTATFTIPQNLADKRVFTEVENALKASLEGAKSVTATRNNADGSARVVIKFDTTEDTDEGDLPPTAHINLTINAFDMNRNDYISHYDTSYKDTGYLVQAGNIVTLTASDVPDMKFISWKLDEEQAKYMTIEEGYKLTDSTIKVKIAETLSIQNISIDADYTAVVSEIHAAIAAPELGKALPKDASLTVKISNNYTIDPEYLNVTWSPADKKTEHMTAYTATVGLKPDNDGNIIVKDGEGNPISYNVNNILFADTIKVTFNDEPATYDTTSLSLSKTFDPIKYTLKQVKKVNDVEGLENGSGYDEVVAALPKTTTIILDDGTEMEAAIEWNDPEKTSTSTDPLDRSEWKAAGTVKLPENMVLNPENVNLGVSIKVTVKEAATAMSPTATPGAGTYLADQVVTLKTNTEDGTTWYTIDDSDPKDEANESRKEYKGEEIVVSREEYPEGLTIRAYTTKDGMRDSAEAMFHYEFTNIVPVPVGKVLPYSGEIQSGVPVSPFYDLEPISEGASLDIYGNAVAKEVGTYKAKASIKEGFKWEVYALTEDEELTAGNTYYEKAEDGSYKRATIEAEPSSEVDSTSVNPKKNGWYEKKETTEDQEITFTITVADLAKSAFFQAEDKYDTLDELKNGIKVINFSQIELEPEDYDLLFEEKPLGMVLVTAVGKRNYTGFITKTIMYLPVVNELKAEIGEPEIDKALPDSAAVTLKLIDEYEVSPDCIEVTWSPADDKVKYDTEYTATIRLVPDADGHIKVRKAGETGGYDVELDTGNLRFAEEIKTTVNGEAADFDAEKKAVSKVFDAIKEDVKPEPEPEPTPTPEPTPEPAPEPAHEHKWDEGKVTKKATDKAEGVITYTCSVCGETKTESIAKVKVGRPKKVTFAKSPKKIIVKWTKVKGASSYVLQYRKAGAKKWKTKKIKKTKFTVKKLKAGGLYQFRIAAVKAETRTTAKITGKYCTPAYRFYRAVKGVKVRAGNRSFKLTWKKVKGASGYIVMYSENKDMTAAKLLKLKGKNKTRRTVKGLEDGKTYYVTVRAYKMRGGKLYKGVRHKAMKVK